jgi:excisionase family DNA binding protein
MESPFDAYVGILEAGARLGIHPDTVRRLVRQGEIPAVKFAGKWMIRRDELEQFASYYDPRPGWRRKKLL